MKKTNTITESQNQNSIDIDTKNVSEIVQIFHNDNKAILDGLEESLDDIKNVVDLTISCLISGGRLLYVGAGTSGRLGVLDASECKPTFSVDKELVQGVIAGGERALTESVEGAEDKIDEVNNIINNKNISSKDIIIGISCSGSAPFVLEFLKLSHKIGATTVLITFNNVDNIKYVDKIIKTYVGPEIISGSTRMKSGTATKMILNMVSSITMIKLNKTYGNYMVDLNVVNKKLEKRAINILKALTDLNNSEAQIILKKSEGKVKNAIIMNNLKVSYHESIRLIAKYNGNLRLILSNDNN